MSRMFMKLITALRILPLGLLLLFCLCMSCDIGIPFSLTPCNFAWSECPTDSPNRYVNSYYSKDGKRYWVVLRCKGSGQVAGADWLVLLCLKENARGKLTVYRLQHGLVLLTYGLEKAPSFEGEIVRLRLLKNPLFEGELHSGRMVLSYNGEVYGKSNYDDGTGKKWLRFEVKPKRNRQKVVSILKALYPLLEKEKHAHDVLECLSPLLDDERK
jgi:hypothetical protein